MSIANASPAGGASRGEPPAATGAVRPVAVVDIGTTSIRMAIAEIGDDRRVRILERLSQAVNLGRDTFTKGAIRKQTIEDCVRVLKSYSKKLAEYQIVRPDQIRVVATSAVREAANRLSFIDRVYSATGYVVEPIDEAEVNRVTYLGILPLLKAEPAFEAARTIIVEVGGGSTEVLAVQGGDVIYAHTYRLGSLRLRETIEAYRAPQAKVRSIMENQIERTVEEVRLHVPPDGAIEMIGLGGDMRFAAAQLLSDWNPDRLGRLPVADLAKFTDRVLAQPVDELVHRFHLALPDAEILGPALLTYLMLVRAFRLEHILVTKFNLRDALLREMSSTEAWTPEFSGQIVRSALDLARRFGVDERHTRHVAELGRLLFRALQDEHRLEPRYELILYVAALLHEIGLFISNKSYHKHSMYIINNSELFGLSRKDLLLASLVARYHRRASPKPSHEGYVSLDRDSRIAVVKMAALLRVADSLDHSRSQRIKELRCRREEGRLIISIPHVADLALEQLALKQKGPLFEETFGLEVLLRRGRA